MSPWWIVPGALAHDVSIGGLQSPLLSWLAALGLLAFFGWQVTRLLADVARASAPFVTLQPLLEAMADEVETCDVQRAYERAFKEDTAGVTRPESTTTDIDRLTRLDTAMRETGAFRRPWVQFRKTLLIERVPWFKEPRIFSTRGADEFFPQDVVLAPSIDLAFYAQLPSVITALGLLLTFVSISIGLSRLHADGTAITGVQGLINGLAGKFLTSIVALVCANAFVLLERPAVRRVVDLHGDFVTLLDESFPRRTVEDLLDALGGRRMPRAPGHPEPGADDVHERLSASIDELTRAVRALAERTAEPDDRFAPEDNVVPMAGRDRRVG